MGIDIPILHEYGIQTEQSDIRAHVSPGACAMFVFPTQSAVAVMRKYPKRTASQPGVIGKTAEGYIVPVADIPDLWALRIDPSFFDGFNECLSTSEKGDRAVKLVIAALKNGGFPLPVHANFSTERNIQISGTDVIVVGKWRIEIKCDYWASMEKGKPNARCTGNVFLQIAERNPLARH